MNIFLNIKKIIFHFIFLSVILCLISCNGPDQCIQPNDFGGMSVSVSAEQGPQTPLATGGGYQTGERINWTNTGYRTNGGLFEIEIEGKWLPTLGHQDAVAKNDLCDTTSMNKNRSDVNNTGGLNTLFYYIKNHVAYVENIDKTITQQDVSSPDQTECWIHGGMGLYIGFFGPEGNQIRNVITHLVLRDLNYCPSSLEHDDDDDDVNLCYRCPREYQQVNNECYELKNGVKIDKRIFKYYTSAFIKDIETKKDNKRTYIEKGEIIKLIILDRYYSDNEGGYEVNFLKGVGEESEGSFAGLIEEFENALAGKVNESTQKREGGVLETLYKNIVRDSHFIELVNVSLIAYIMLLGFSIMIGTTEISQKEFLVRLLKIAFVITMTSPGSWSLFNDIFVGFFVDGMGTVIATLREISDAVLFGNSFNAFSNEGKFTFIDKIIDFIFSKNYNLKVIGLLFGAWYGFIVVILIYIVTFYFIIVLIKATFPYIIAFVQITLALSLSPIFITFFLFEKTQHLFKQWLTFLSARCAEIIFLFLLLYLMVSFIESRLHDLVAAKTCRMPLLEAISGLDGMVVEWFSLGIKVWKTEVSMGFIEFIVEIVLLFLAIKFFQLLIGKINEIVAALLDVWGENLHPSPRGRHNSGISEDHTPSSVGKLTGKVGGWIGGKMASGLKTGGLFIAKNVVARGVMRGANILSAGAIPGYNGIGPAIYNFKKDRKANNLIKVAETQGKSLGKEGKDLEEFVQHRVLGSHRAKREGKEQGLSGVGLGKYVDSNSEKLGKLSREAFAERGTAFSSVDHRIERALEDRSQKAYFTKLGKVVKETNEYLSAQGVSYGSEVRAPSTSFSKYKSLDETGRDILHTEVNKRMSGWADKHLAGGAGAITDSMRDGTKRVVTKSKKGGAALRKGAFISAKKEAEAKMSLGLERDSSSENLGHMHFEKGLLKQRQDRERMKAFADGVKDFHQHERNISTTAGAGLLRPFVGIRNVFSGWWSKGRVTSRGGLVGYSKQYKSRHITAGGTFTPGDGVLRPRFSLVRQANLSVERGKADKKGIPLEQHLIEEETTKMQETVDQKIKGRRTSVGMMELQEKLEKIGEKDREIQARHAIEKMKFIQKYPKELSEVAEIAKRSLIKKEIAEEKVEEAKNPEEGSAVTERYRIRVEKEFNAATKEAERTGKDLKAIEDEIRVAKEIIQDQIKREVDGSLKKSRLENFLKVTEAQKLLIPSDNSDVDINGALSKIAEFAEMPERSEIPEVFVDLTPQDIQVVAEILPTLEPLEPEYSTVVSAIDRRRKQQIKIEKGKINLLKIQAAIAEKKEDPGLELLQKKLHAAEVNLHRTIGVDA